MKPLVCKRLSIGPLGRWGMVVLLP